MRDPERIDDPIGPARVEPFVVCDVEHQAIADVIRRSKSIARVIEVQSGCRVGGRPRPRGKQVSAECPARVSERLAVGRSRLNEARGNARQHVDGVRGVVLLVVPSPYREIPFVGEVVSDLTEVRVALLTEGLPSVPAAQRKLQQIEHPVAEEAVAGDDPAVRTVSRTDNGTVETTAACEVVPVAGGCRLACRACQHGVVVERLSESLIRRLQEFAALVTTSAVRSHRLVPVIHARAPVQAVLAAGDLKLVAVELRPLQVMVEEDVELRTGVVEVEFVQDIGLAEQILQIQIVGQTIVDGECCLLELLVIG